MLGSKETGKKDFGDLDNDGYVSDELQQSSNKIAQLEEFDYKISDKIAKPASDLQKAKTTKIDIVDQNQNTETGRKNTKNDKLSLYDDEYSIAINSQNPIKDIKNETVINVAYRQIYFRNSPTRMCFDLYFTEMKSKFFISFDILDTVFDFL